VGPWYWKFHIEVGSQILFRGKRTIFGGVISDSVPPWSGTKEISEGSAGNFAFWVAFLKDSEQADGSYIVITDRTERGLSNSVWFVLIGHLWVEI
jgi:hypothetical protein